MRRVILTVGVDLLILRGSYFCNIIHIFLYRYQYDGNARLSAVDVDINSKQLPQIRLKHNQNLGMLESISDLRIFRNMFNKSVMQDNAKQFLTIIDYDSHGRIKSVLINIKAFDVFRYSELKNHTKTIE